MLHVFSYGTDETRCNRLRRSGERCGVGVSIGGPGSAWGGYTDKLRAFDEHLAGLPAADVAMFVDAYDTVFVADAAEIIERFEAYGAALVFSGERGLWPEGDAWIADLYAKTGSPFRFVNSGAYMGRVGALRDMLAAPADDRGHRDALGRWHEGADDQRFLTTFYLQNTERVALDRRQRIFANLFGTRAERYRVAGPQSVVSLYSGERTCVLHGNGALGGAVLDELCREIESRDVEVAPVGGGPTS